ncbi:Fur family transcriptional regulator [Lactobacillus selangorensis]|nr:Fur family transcriptional regulator [Lactobacillus selangorensis]
MTTENSALALLKKHGYRLTSQRRDLINYLSQFQDHYITVTALDAYMRKRYPGMSHNTIYRNVKEFVEAGILEEQEEGEQARVKFQCDFEQPHHHHFICRNCGKVTELKMCPIDFFTDQLPGYEIDGHRIEMYGLCPDCQKKLKAAS